ncbi:hypothetical protein B566_EDAN004120 [Ephemera danica]|nr:hypothetical protein B566_EDAN004120 [Ephemera danica]
MAALTIPRGCCLTKYRHLSPAIGSVKLWKNTSQRSTTRSIIFQGIRHHHIATSIHGQHILTPQNKLLKQSGFASCGHIVFAWRAASTVNIPDPPPNTFVKYSNPAESAQSSPPVAESVYSSPLDLSQTTATPSSILDTIPEPPSLPVAEVTEVLNAAGEATFASIGLGGWTPVGIVQNCMEYLHIACDLPWWTSIMIGTLCVRIIIFPLVIMAQRNAAKMNNNLPQLQVLQMKMTEARQSGNQLEAARYAQEMMLFMKEKDLSPFRNVLAPLFISFFLGLRRMANVPVESMKEGGLFWFTDLTVPDQYFLLPILTSATMWLTIEIGTDTARLSASNMQTMKYVLRAMPLVILPFTINFPGAILCYWVSTNFISLLQVGFLRIPAVREYFKIDKLIVHNPDSLPQKNKGFVKGFRESWTNMKITKELEDRQRFDEIQFQKSGRGPVPKTYKYDPTRQTRDAIAAKKRDPK